jgi:membrane associated rhomboid family serine protease
VGLHDRPYYREDQSGGHRQGGGLQLGLPKPGKAVKWLLIINVSVFFLQLFMDDWFVRRFAAVPMLWWQPWRYLTFQFLHGSPMHLAFNMIGLYFLGMILEQSWGTRRFLRFYLICGVVAGLSHVVLSLMISSNWRVPLLGASGGVFAVVAACAILFPHIRVIVFLFPMSIRAAALLFLGIALVGVLMEIRAAVDGSPSAGGVAHMAHLGGAAAAVIWVLALPRLQSRVDSRRERVSQGAWNRKMNKQRQAQMEIDRILDKIRLHGLDSMTRKERKTLRDATAEQRKEERDLLKP